MGTVSKKTLMTIHATSEPEAPPRIWLSALRCPRILVLFLLVRGHFRDGCRKTAANKCTQPSLVMHSKKKSTLEILEKQYVCVNCTVTRGRDLWPADPDSYSSVLCNMVWSITPLLLQLVPPSFGAMRFHCKWLPVAHKTSSHSFLSTTESTQRA